VQRVRREITPVRVRTRVDFATGIYRRHTGRTVLPSTLGSEAWVVAGRRSKSRVAEVIAV
jgi:hypothetical protein